MKLVSDNRASRILYNFLSSNVFERPVVVPSNVCEVVPVVFKEAGVGFIYSDIDTNSLCLDLNQILNHLDEYSGILFVHTYGLERSFECFFKEIKKSNPDFLIIDDRCLCNPSTSVPDTLADLCLFSVGEKKQVDLGMGGFAYLQDNLSYRICDLNPGSFLNDSDWCFDASLIESATRDTIIHRDRLNAIYRRYLPKTIQLQDDYQNWRFNILVDNNHSILEALFANGLFASSHYRPLTDTSNNAAWLHRHIINLFNDFHYSEEMAVKTCSIINSLI